MEGLFVYNTTMITFPELLVYALAVFRLSILFVREEGPLHIFRRIRELAGITHDDDGNVVIIPDTFRAGILSCVWCFSVWAGIAVTVLWLLLPSASLLLTLPFALSGVAILLDSRLD
jgi:hypothetical protein